MTLHLGVLVSGNGSNLQAIIDTIEAGKLNAQIVAVISDNEQAFALKRAERHQIFHETVLRKDFKDKAAFEKKILETLKRQGAEWIVLAGFMRLISPDFLNEYPQRVINIHPALLPAFPGLEAIRQAFEAKAKITGCTVHLVDEGCDTGPIIAQRSVEVDPADTLESLTQKVHREEHRLYPEVLQWIAEGRLKVEGRKVIVAK